MRALHPASGRPASPDLVFRCRRPDARGSSRSSLPATLLIRWCAVVCTALLFTPALTDTNAARGSDNATSVTATVSASVLGAESSTLALRALTVLALRAGGVDARAAPTPPTPPCATPDAPACLGAALGALTAGNATVALLNVAADAAPAAWQLRDSGIEELGDAAPPSRRACLATKASLRSLLDLSDPTLADQYHLPVEDLARALSNIADTNGNTCITPSCNNDIFTPAWCESSNTSCATLLTSNAVEARVLAGVVRSYHLQATVLPLGPHLAAVASALARPLVACDWAPETTSLADLEAVTLGPPPCRPSESCPFETRRLIKFVNIRELARAPSAILSLVRLTLSVEELRKMAAAARAVGPDAAARAILSARPANMRPGEVRVAVLLPNATNREAYDARALAAAAALAEEDVERERLPGNARFKVEVYDDGCHTTRAYKYLNDALGNGEFGALSALAGPACGAAWADVARLSPAHSMPVLAYTVQAPAAGATSLDADTRLQLLAAGDAREFTAAMAALLSHYGWRRLAVLNEAATRPLADTARLHAEFAVHLELPEDETQSHSELIADWASRVASANAHIIYLCVEDARVARAALCAAHAAGLRPEGQTVWLLCAEPPKGWLRATPGDNCTTEQLEEVAAGYLSLTPEWAIEWEESSNNASSERLAWEARWGAHCRRVAWGARGAHGALGARGAGPCRAPPPHAALLYDALRLWAGALARLLVLHPAAIDDLHDLRHVRALIEDATTTEFVGLTGRFEWVGAGAAHARAGALVLAQRGGARALGRWARGRLAPGAAARWRTADGAAPDDGGEHCALAGAAAALRVRCRTAWVALGAALAAAVLLALGGAAFACRRRAEREYRARLAALGMRPLAGKPAGLDRWEVPRERVVINRKLGMGAFGTVYGGHALLAEDRGWTAVAVKTLKAGASTEEKLDFLSEAEAMKRFDHKNVVRLLGVVTKTAPVCTVMEFMLYGDLKNYLLARRHLALGGAADAAGAEADEASPRRLTGMALDAARALSYLAQLRYVHRDVAARNCLVSARRTLKLADFGMTRLVFEHDYYRFSRKGMLPVRWMAPESLALGVFSPASDVWSFGVLLYEIVTFGSLPFQGLSNSEVLARVKAGHTLDLPPGLKPQLEGLIKSCWQQDSKKRPTASEVAAFLADAPRLLSPCLDVPLDALPLDADPPWRLPRDQAEARWVSWAAPASAATDTTYLSADGAVPLDTDSFLP